MKNKQHTDRRSKRPVGVAQVSLQQKVNITGCMQTCVRVSLWLGKEVDAGSGEGDSGGAGRCSDCGRMTGGGRWMQVDGGA